MGGGVVRVVGIGFRAAAELASLQDALRLALEGMNGSKIDALVTEASKARAPVFRKLAELAHVPGLGIVQSDLAQMITPTQSAHVQDRFGTGSLAEAAALAASGPAARLVVERVISMDGMATAAVAEAAE